MWSSAQLIRTPSTQGVDGVKACQAVRAGIERGLYQALQAPPPPAAGPAGPASPITVPALSGALAGLAAMRRTSVASDDEPVRESVPCQ
jgi:hypothetical protein